MPTIQGRRHQIENVQCKKMQNKNLALQILTLGLLRQASMVETGCISTLPGISTTWKLQ